MDEEYTISYDALIHPDLEALARRDNFLNNNNDVNIIQMDNNGIIAEVNLNEKICNNCYTETNLRGLRAKIKPIDDWEVPEELKEIINEILLMEDIYQEKNNDKY